MLFSLVPALALGWEVPARGGILHLVAFCFCKTSETFTLQMGSAGICLFPGQGAVIRRGFPCFPWWGLAPVHVDEETCSPVLFVRAAAPDFAPHGTSLPPQHQRASRYCSIGCASLQLPQPHSWSVTAGPGFSNCHVLQRGLWHEDTILLCVSSLSKV